MATLSSLKPDEIWQKLPYYAEYPEFSWDAGPVIPCFPEYLQHPSQMASSAGCVGPLPHLGTDAFWALKQEPTLPHAFVSPPLLTVVWIIFGTGLLSCCEPVLPAPVHNWLGLMSCSSMSLLREQRKQSGSPHPKPVCNISWSRTHIPLMRSVKQTDGHAWGLS